LNDVKFINSTWRTTMIRNIAIMAAILGLSATAAYAAAPETVAAAAAACCDFIAACCGAGGDCCP
jgi:hypothetical protein